MPPVFELLALFELPVAFEFVFPPMFEFIFEFMFELFALPVALEFVLFAFPLALPFALSAGVQAVQTLATARRVRSASVLRIEFPPVPPWGSDVGELRGPSLAFTPRAFSLQLVGLVLGRRLARPRFPQNVSGEGSAPQRVTWARQIGRAHV